MPIFNLARPVYVFARKVITASGLSGPLRSSLGPLAGRIVSRFVANPTRPSLVQGHKMTLAANGGYPPVAMAMDRYEEETTNLFQKLLKPGMVVVDVGAHVGYYSLLAARQVGPEGKVYAFEPEPTNHELLLDNIQRNGYTNIVSQRKAVSNSVGSTSLYLTNLDNGRHSAYRHGLPERGRVNAETITLDAFLDAEGWPKVDLVKVDVEGAENDVLDGMNRLWQRSPDLKLIMEFNPTFLNHAAANPLQLLEMLSSLGFVVHRVVDSDGPVLLHDSQRDGLVDGLLKSEGSVNLFCCKK